jgi:hypothetical protein
MAVAMVAGAGLVIFLGTRGHHDDDPPPPPPPKAGPQWIGRDAVPHLVAPGGKPGPLFDGMTLGGAAPTDVQRARVDEFAKKNDMDIALEMHDDKLAAIRVGITFKGGFGSEGAEVFALRFQRPSTGTCCVCGPDTWINSWAYVLEGGVRVRARIKANRVEARWERAATYDELFAGADELLGKDFVATREAAGDRWHEVTAYHLLEAAMPYPRERPRNGRSDGSDLGFLVEEQGGKIVAVTLALDDSDDNAKDIERAARARWGHPRVDESEWSRKRHDRAVQLRNDYRPRLLIHHPGYTTGIPF